MRTTSLTAVLAVLGIGVFSATPAAADDVTWLACTEEGWSHTLYSELDLTKGMFEDYKAKIDDTSISYTIFSTAAGYNGLYIIVSLDRFSLIRTQITYDNGSQIGSTIVSQCVITKKQI